MSSVTPEILYDEYRRQALLKRKGIHAKAMKDFSKARENPNWVHYVRLAKLVNDNGGHVDYRVYMEALVEFFDGFVPDRLMPTQKAIRIYKNYVTRMNCERNNSEGIERGVIRSLRNVAAFMRSEGLGTFDEYASHNASMIPTLAKHFSAGTVTKHFLALVPRLDLVLGQYPQDIRDEYFTGVIGGEYDQLRVSLFRQEKLKRISDNLERLVSMAVKSKDDGQVHK